MVSGQQDSTQSGRGTGGLGVIGWNMHTRSCKTNIRAHMEHEWSTTKSTIVWPFLLVDASANTYGTGCTWQSFWDWDSNTQMCQSGGLCSSLPCLAVSVCPRKDTVLRKSCLGSVSLTSQRAMKSQPSHALGAKQSWTWGILPHLPSFWLKHNN